MQDFDRYELLTALFKGTVTVTFRKIDTDEIRVMPCTLNPELLEANGVTITVDYSAKDQEHFAVWSLDKNAWRSFRLDTVEGWEVL
jgi:hypothetical protein